MESLTYDALPIECRLEVLGYLDFHSLFAVRLVSHQSQSDVEVLERARWYPAQLIAELSHRHRRHIAASLALCRPSYAWSMGYTPESFVDYFLAYWHTSVETLQAEGVGGHELLCQITARKMPTMPFCR
ncbi:hypothetical protein BCR37DRAFT_96515 [Protomyces lactucae-debilis]|uniref:F-box domain-containing protein n=1 Tax=Protomyces lactucae-debilis TaxID=2754530 RepID=A0A1Y2F6L6_PROLT|nr:uncharacterized protein BCR37DRAFT_96515 [Protomyces lactucae-debilis]ORY79521.1 hypothetical protein BCR37DRAFT_96515 [Protomyces lactucae-debilis]